MDESESKERSVPRSRLSKQSSISTLPEAMMECVAVQDQDQEIQIPDEIMEGNHQDRASELSLIEVRADEDGISSGHEMRDRIDSMTHIEPLVGSPVPSGFIRSLTTTDIPSQSERYHPRRGRLKGASKAFIFLRRAASTISDLTKHLNRSSETSSTRNSSRIYRQNTGDSLHSQTSNSNCPQSTNSGARYGSGVPKFLVPKMNHLKLPLVCRIKSIEDELMREVFVHQYEVGHYLMENLKISIGIVDSKYFGLKMAKCCDDQEDLRNPWVDLNESVYKQIKNHGILARQTSSDANGSQEKGNEFTQRSTDFYLRIKFYPPNLGRIQDPFLKQYLWLQLRRDLRLGKLTSSMSNLTYLTACVLQYELGDYRDELVERIPSLNILPNQDLLEDRAIEIWRSKWPGSRKHKAQMQFLRASFILETYGFEYYPVKDHQRQRTYLFGFNYAGIKTIRNGRIVHHFRWHSINKIAHERRMIILHVHPTDNSTRKQVLGFKCLTNADCQTLLIRLLEQKYFFTVDLAYFDKQTIPRQTPCLYGSSSASVIDWNSIPDDQTSRTLDGGLNYPYSLSNRIADSHPVESDSLRVESGNETQSKLRDDHYHQCRTDCCCVDGLHESNIDRNHPSKANGIESGLRETNNSSAGDNLMDLTSDQQCDGAYMTKTVSGQYSTTSLNRETTSGGKSSLRNRLAYRWAVNSDIDVNRFPESASNLPAHDGQSALTSFIECIKEYSPRAKLKLASLADSILAETETCGGIFGSGLVSSIKQPELEQKKLLSLPFRLLRPAARFCLLVLMAKLVLIATDSISNALIELLTMKQSP